MPSYSWLLANRVDPEDIQASLTALSKVGVPYSADQIANAPATMQVQALEIVGRLAAQKITAEPDREIIALIAYLQRLGKDGRAAIAAGQGGGPSTP
jgi:cytochrome c oxidase cbb3-type subunit I/II